MGEKTFLDRVRDVVCSVAWPLFLWSINMTEGQYFKAIYEQERHFRTMAKEGGYPLSLYTFNAILSLPSTSGSDKMSINSLHPFIDRNLTFSGE